MTALGASPVEVAGCRVVRNPLQGPASDHLHPGGPAHGVRRRP